MEMKCIQKLLNYKKIIKKLIFSFFLNLKFSLYLYSLRRKYKIQIDSNNHRSNNKLNTSSYSTYIYVYMANN